MKKTSKNLTTKKGTHSISTWISGKSLCWTLLLLAFFVEFLHVSTENSLEMGASMGKGTSNWPSPSVDCCFPAYFCLYIIKTEMYIRVPASAYQQCHWGWDINNIAALYQFLFVDPSLKPCTSFINQTTLHIKLQKTIFELECSRHVRLSFPLE